MKKNKMKQKFIMMAVLMTGLFLLGGSPAFAQKKATDKETNKPNAQRYWSNWAKFSTGVVTGINTIKTEFSIDGGQETSFGIYAPSETDEFVEKGKKYTLLMLTNKKPQEQAYIVISFINDGAEIKKQILEGTPNAVKFTGGDQTLQKGDKLEGRSNTKAGVTEIVFEVSRKEGMVTHFGFEVNSRTSNNDSTTSKTKETGDTTSDTTTDETTKCTIKTNGGRLNVRSLAGKVLFKVNNNDAVNVIEQSKDGRAKISLSSGSLSKDSTGWVPRKYLNCDSN